MTRALASLLLTCVIASGQTNYTDVMYRRALENQSTAPLYVGWKLGLYGRALLSNGTSSWVRTARVVAVDPAVE